MGEAFDDQGIILTVQYPVGIGAGQCCPRSDMILVMTKSCIVHGDDVGVEAVSQFVSAINDQAVRGKYRWQVGRRIQPSQALHAREEGGRVLALLRRAMRLLYRGV